MSSFEALRAAARHGVAWLRSGEEAEPTPPPPPSPLEEAERLLALAKTVGQIDRLSGTWNAVARWAAGEVILAQRALETASDEKAAALRARIRTLRDLLEIDERADATPLLQDNGPDIP